MELESGKKIQYLVKNPDGGEGFLRKGTFKGEVNTTEGKKYKIGEYEASTKRIIPKRYFLDDIEAIEEINDQNPGRPAAPDEIKAFEGTD